MKIGEAHYNGRTEQGGLTLRKGYQGKLPKLGTF